MKKFHPTPAQVGRAARSAGFTILELMIAVAVLGILLGIGVPSFQGIMRQNRLAAQTNELLAAAAMARSEAVKRGTTVSICPMTAPDADENVVACADNSSWSNGWMVFSDDQGTVGEYDHDGTEPDDVIIQRWTPSTDRRITVTNAAVTSLTYRGDGGTTLGAGGATIFTVAPEAGYCSNAQGARDVTITATGRVNAVRRDCP
jgi:type IV fimbrial biogenesis protein FimT